MGQRCNMSLSLSLCICLSLSLSLSLCLSLSSSLISAAAVGPGPACRGALGGGAARTPLGHRRCGARSHPSWRLGKGEGEGGLAALFLILFFRMFDPLTALEIVMVPQDGQVI